MDTISDADYYVISLFQNGSYRAAISAYESLPSSPSTLLTLYCSRSHLALSPSSTSSALSLLSSLPEQTLDVRAVTSLAQYLSGEKEQSVSDLEELQIELGDAGLEEGTKEGRFVRGIIATVWILEGQESGRMDEGVEILREAIELGKDQECLGILCHLYLSLSLASQSSTLLSAPSTTEFTSDSLQSQLFSARTNLLLGPRTNYEQSYYVYEEIKGLQGGRGESTLNGVAVAQASMQRWDEAVQAILESLEMNDSHPTSLANFIALARYYVPSLATEGSTEPLNVEKALNKLNSIEPNHPFLLDLKEKSNAFDEAAAKFGGGTIMV